VILIDRTHDLAELQRTVEETAASVAAVLSRVRDVLLLLDKDDKDDDDDEDPFCSLRWDVADALDELADALDELADLPDDCARIISRAAP